MWSGTAGGAVEVYEDPASDRRADSEGECEYDSTDEKDDDEMEREARERHLG